MPRRAFSTDNLPDDLSEAERFSYLRDAIAEPVFGVTPERSERPTWARIDARIGSTISCLYVAVHAGPVRRLSCNIAKQSFEESIWLYRERGTWSWWNDGRTELAVRAGGVLVFDPTIGYSSGAQGAYDFDSWHLPRSLIEPHLPADFRLRMCEIPAGSAVNHVLIAYLDALRDRVDTLESGESAAIADNLCRLVAVACGSPGAEHREPLRAARLEEAKRHIARRLADPELSPESVATALNISLRQLHALFEPTGTTFAQYVLARRLAECRAALAQGDRAVTDIALAWGFNSLATFYRNFRRAYGIAPGDLRGSSRR